MTNQTNINSIAGRIGTFDPTSNGAYDEHRRNELYEFQLHQLEQTKKKKIKTRDSDCCSINFVTYVLHIFNIIFFVSLVSNSSNFIRTRVKRLISLEKSSCRNIRVTAT